MGSCSATTPTRSTASARPVKTLALLYVLCLAACKSTATSHAVHDPRTGGVPQG